MELTGTLFNELAMAAQRAASRTDWREVRRAFGEPTRRPFTVTDSSGINHYYLTEDGMVWIPPDALHEDWSLIKVGDMTIASRRAMLMALGRL